MKKLVCTTLAACVLTSMVTPAFAADLAGLPNFNNGTNVAIDDTSTPNTLNVITGKVGADGKFLDASQQNGVISVSNWDSFNVDEGKTVDFQFTGHNQTSINKVDATTGSISKIYGNIKNSTYNNGTCVDCGYEATSKVFLLNPNGVIFGETANVDLNSFTVSTYNLVYDENDPAQLYTFLKSAEATSDYTLVETIDTEGMSETQKQQILNDNPNAVLTTGGKIKVYQRINAITLKPGATVHGAKGVNFVADTIYTYGATENYRASLISTDVAPNYNPDDANNFQDSYGKVKLVTSDGVTFGYAYEQYDNNDNVIKDADGNIMYSANGSVNKVYVNESWKNSQDQMSISLNGNIDAGQIDIRNHSANANSSINIKGATLKATKAVNGNDGDIYLTSNNKIIIEDSNFETLNYNDAAALRVPSRDTTAVGTVLIKANGNISIANSKIDAVNNVELFSKENDVVVSGSDITAKENFLMNAGGIASVQNYKVAEDNIKQSNIEAKNVDIKGKSVYLSASALTAHDNMNVLATATVDDIKAATEYNNTASAEAQKKDAGSIRITNAIINAKNATLDSKYVLFKNATVNASENLNVNVDATAEETDAIAELNLTRKPGTEMEAGSIVADYLSTLNAKQNTLNATNNVKGNLDLKNNKTNILAGNNINLNLKGANNEYGLVAEAGNDMALTTDGTLSVSSLISGKDMTLTANEIKAGTGKIGDNPDRYFDEAGDSADRAYIEVGGKFISNPDYNSGNGPSASTAPTADGKYNQKHWIEYPDGSLQDKILLVNKLEAPANDIPPRPLPNVNDDQASMLNKLPQQPQSIKPSNNITDGRTMFLDVFAAASQIEIDDEEE